MGYTRLDAAVSAAKKLSKDSDSRVLLVQDISDYTERLEYCLFFADNFNLDWYRSDTYPRILESYTNGHKD